LFTLDIETGFLDDLRYPVAPDENSTPSFLTLRFSAFGDMIGLSTKPDFRIISVSSLTGLVEHIAPRGRVFSLIGILPDGF
jgi:hypothetical protein